jgi:hypothetical protein
MATVMATVMAMAMVFMAMHTTRKIKTHLDTELSISSKKYDPVKTLNFDN